MANVTKRGDSYRIRVYCGVDDSGKKIMRSTTYTPEKGVTARQIEKALNKAVVEFEESALNATKEEYTKVKLSEFFKQYLNNVKHELSPKNYENYEHAIDSYIIPMLGHLKLRDIRPIHIQKFVNTMCEDGIRRDKKEGKLAPSTVHRYYVILQSIMHNAYSLEIIPQNPADNAKIKLPSKKPEKIDIYTKDQAEIMLKCLEDEPLMYRLLIHLALTTGARRGELVALKWEDIDFCKNTIIIRRSNYQLKGKQAQSKSTKTGKERTVVIPEYCKDLLKQHSREQTLQRLAMGDQWENGNWIFTQWNGRPMYPTSPTQWFTRFQSRHDLPHKKCCSSTRTLENSNDKPVCACD